MMILIQHTSNAGLLGDILVTDKLDVFAINKL